MFPSDFFRHCPRCAARGASVPGGAIFMCDACGFRYYFNPASAAVAFIERADGHVLFIRRAKEPAAGRLAPPGGFVDFGETAEDSLRREVREEVNVELTGLRYLCSHPNRYLHAEITYRVLDIFFVARAVNPDTARPQDEVREIHWLPPASVRPEDMAFPSMAAALRTYQAALAAVTAL